MLLNSLINTHLAAEKARDLDLHQLPEYKKRMERIGDQILERMLLSRVIENQISEAQVKKRYEELRVQAETSFEVHARHILLKTPDAAQLMLDNLQNGADFASLATQHSTGPSARSGGDLGWFGPGDMLPEFEKAAMALKPGEYTKKPVETKLGWHIIKMEDRRPLVIPSFEDARIAITNELSATAGNTLMDQMRKDADVKQIEWQDLK
jgi:peptidyl-prolyl cis-trans isomerase C